MKVLVKEPGKTAEVREIENTLEACQKIVKGYIEVVPIAQDLILVVNEEGKINGMKLNFAICGDIIYGPAFFCGKDGEEFCGLTHDQIESMRILIPALF